MDRTEENLKRLRAVDAEETWRTINGSHVLINENGEITAGAGGKFNGQKFGSGKRKSSKVENLNKLVASVKGVGGGENADGAYENLKNKPKYGIIKSNEGPIFPVLTNRKTGKKLYTETRPIEVTAKMRKELKQQGWEFDWDKPAKKGFQVHAVYEAGTDKIAGLIAFKHKQGFTLVDVAETNPKNRGKNGEYKNTSWAMFAFAAAESFLHGNEGWVSWKAMTHLVPFYEKEFGAKLLGDSSQMMELQGPKAAALLDRFKGN